MDIPKEKIEEFFDILEAARASIKAVQGYVKGCDHTKQYFTSTKEVSKLLDELNHVMDSYRKIPSSDVRVSKDFLRRVEAALEAYKLKL